MRPKAAVSAYMAEIGRKGGQTKGSSKRRSKAHYKAAAEKRWSKERDEDSPRGNKP